MILQFIALTSPSTNTSMQIFVRGTAKLLAINVESDDTVNDVYVSLNDLKAF